MRRLCVVVDDGSLLSHNHKFLECSLYLFFSSSNFSRHQRGPAALCMCGFAGVSTPRLSNMCCGVEKRGAGFKDKFYAVQETAAQIRIKIEYVGT
jgi:hypothetical protein